MSGQQTIPAGAGLPDAATVEVENVFKQIDTLKALADERAAHIKDLQRLCALKDEIIASQRGVIALNGGA